ncbi:hypothetical protein [Streptomyces sp. NPDC001165]|uniref:hypothetical protein n=1 Tax=Streptomyces sp. NPDC001165 TaxID=3364546 RepID=UPI0036BF1BA3
MVEYPGFGVLLARLSDHRSLDAGTLSRQAGIPELELLRLFEGAVPTPPLLRRLAPALRMHTADLFVMAQAAVPDDLAPVDVGARGEIPGLVKHAMLLPSDRRAELRSLVRSLREEGCALPSRPVLPYEPGRASPGGLMVRMVFNRNVGWAGMAKVFLVLTGRYWSPSTYAQVAAGRKELTPDLVTDFGTVLGIPAQDLSALAGLGPLGEASGQEPTAADVAALLWDLRTLSADQVLRVAAVTRSMRP